MAVGASVRGYDRSLELFNTPEPRLRPDLFLLMPFLVLSALGIVMVYSASAPRLRSFGLDPSQDMRRQIMFVIVGVAVFLIASLFDARTLRYFTPVIYFGSIIGLILVLTPLGTTRSGATRWIEIAGFQLQPSEFAKIAVILTLAALLSHSEGKLHWGRLGRAVVVVALPAFMIFRQPDLGTMLVFGFIALVAVFAAGATWRQLAFLILALIIGTVGLFQLGAVKDYQVERLTAFLDETADPDALYNQRQSEIAVGSGGLLGRGLFEGSLTNLSFVPAQSTDFIFTAVGEQLGFMGGVVVIGLYMMIVWRLLMTAVLAKDRFGSLIAVGVSALVTFHVFVNIGMTIGVMPVTGLPLPWMSAGGTAFIAMSLAIGLAHSVWMRRGPLPGERTAAH